MIKASASVLDPEGELESHLIEQEVPQDSLNSLAGEILIGGIALAENTTVEAQNIEDFDLLPGVDVES